MGGDVLQRNTPLGAGFQELVHQIEALVTDADVVGERQGFALVYKLPERVAAVEHHVEDNAQRPDAGLVSVILFPLDHFRRVIQGRPCNSRRASVSIGLRATSEESLSLR